MLEEKVRKWQKTKSVALATEICQMLVQIYDDIDEKMGKLHEEIDS